MSSPTNPTTPSVQVPDSIVIPANDTPSYANMNILDGAVLGNLLTMGGSAGTEAAGTVVGAAIGSVYGKKRMEKEYEQGKTINKPASNTLYKSLGALGVGLITAAFSVASRASAATVAVWTAAGASLGAALGHLSHKNRAEEFDKAKDYYVQHGGNYRSRAVEAKPATPQPNQEEMQAMKARIAELEGQSKADKVAASKQQVPATQL